MSQKVFSGNTVNLNSYLLNPSFSGEYNPVSIKTIGTFGKCSD